MNELFVRTVTGIILAAAAVLSVLYFPVWLFKITIALITGVGTWEIFHLLDKRFEGINSLFFGVYGFFLSLALLFLSPVLTVFLIFLISFYTAHKIYSLDTLTASVFGLSYGVFFISSLALLHEQNKYLMFVLFATVWAGDTMAYFTGKTIGKHRLAPRLSPKKTWEGAFGSVIGSVLAGGLTAYFFNIPESVIPVLIASVLMQVGDLFESFLKRQVGEKDSSHLIPGHGGLLDRIDALIFASVIFVIFFQFRNTL